MSRSLHLVENECALGVRCYAELSNFAIILQKPQACMVGGISQPECLFLTCWRYTLCSEKTPTHVFFLYICGRCLDFHKIFSDCLGGNRYSTGGKVKIFFATGDVMMTSYFCVCKLWVLPLKTGIWWNAKTYRLENMLIHHAIFHCELFSWFIFLAECEILNFVDVGILTRTAHSVDDRLPAISRMAWYCQSC